MQKIKLQKDIEITPKIVEYVIKKHEAEKKRIRKLNKYYENENEIKNREYTDKYKPQNKLSNGYGTYITNTAVGYFLGKQISYKSDNNKPLLKKINEIYKFNDEADHNTTLAKQASIQGYAVELMYMDDAPIPNIRFKAVQGDEIAVVYDNTLEENINFAIRYFEEYDVDKDENIIFADVYTKDCIYHYKIEGDKTYSINNENGDNYEEHFFKDVPVTVYMNNDEGMGDFERVKDLIDAYDKVQSDSANDFEYFTNCILAVYGEIVDSEMMEELKEARVLNFQQIDSKAEYLIKNIQDVALENYKNRLDNDIHKFSGVPNMSDESFGSNASGIALQFKLMSIENITGIKEAKFKKGILRRNELICNVLTVKEGQDNAFLDIVPVFTRTKPINEYEEAQKLQILNGIIPEETLFSIASFIDNPQEEIERKKREQLSIYDDNYSENEELDNANTEE